MRTELELLIQAAKQYKEYQSIGNGAKLSEAIETAELALQQPDVSGQFCGTCETELQLWNIKFKQWYCPQCRTYLPQYFR